MSQVHLARPVDFYGAPPELPWRSGRTDSTTDRLAFRLHQVIQPNPILFGADGRPIHLQGSPSKHSNILLGFSCDEGVRRNLGRPGAASGPDATRRALASLPFHDPSFDIVDAGDLVYREAVSGEPLAGVQAALTASVQMLLGSGHFPIVMGGGNEASWGTGKGIYDWARSFTPHKKVGIVLWDAHFDLRSVEERGVSSGTPFWQLAQDAQTNGDPFHYMCLGVRRVANTARLFATANELGAHFVTADDFMEINLHRLAHTLDTFIDGVDVIFETVDLDVFGAGHAPGVSAVNPDGLIPGPLFYHLFDCVTRSGKLVAFETTELSPPNDAADGRTAKLAATLIERVIHEQLQPSH